MAFRRTSTSSTMANSPTVGSPTNAPVFPVGGIVDPPTAARPGLRRRRLHRRCKVALVQRGTCPFVDKRSLAQAADATA